MPIPWMHIRNTLREVEMRVAENELEQEEIDIILLRVNELGKEISALEQIRGIEVVH